MITGKATGAEGAVERLLVARQHALHAAVALELGLAGDDIAQGLSAQEAELARNIVMRTAGLLEEWLLRDPEPEQAPRGYRVTTVNGPEV